MKPRLSLLVSVFTLALVLAVSLTACSEIRKTVDAGPSGIAGPKSEAASLDLTSLTMTIEDKVVVVGEVTNVGGKALTLVRAVARFYDDKGKLVGEESALIDEGAHFAPDRTSAFRIEADPATMPGVARVGVDFYQGEIKLATKHSWYKGG